MAEQLTTNAEALRLFFTDDVYLVKSEDLADMGLPVAQAPAPVVVHEQKAVVEIPKPPAVAEVSAVPDVAADTVSPAAIPSLPKVTASPSATETVFKYLGKNQKNVLILVNDGDNDVSSEGGRELLRNLVKAMQLTANDFALLNYFNYTHVKFEELSKFFGTKLVLGFGVSPVQLGLNDQPQHSIGTHGAVQLVFTGRLDLLAADQDGKKKLWLSLKQFTF